MTTDLEDLEARVTAKWAAAAADRIQCSGMFDPSAWTEAVEPWSAGVPPESQFPREQWASYPAKRTVALILADRLLDFDELTDEQWMQVCFIVQFGGRERVG